MENEKLLSDLLEEMKLLNQTQKDISHSLDVLIRSEVETRLTHIFNDGNEILVYQLSDGKRSTSEITKFLDVSRMSISRLWKKWEEELGIVETDGFRKPYKAKYTLEELALLFGKPSKNNSSQPEKKE